MRDAGFDGWMKPCQWTCPLSGPAEQDQGHADFELAFRNDAGNGWAFVGRRADGTTGVMVSYTA